MRVFGERVCVMYVWCVCGVVCACGVCVGVVRVWDVCFWWWCL